jgi:hypothetical protein
LTMLSASSSYLYISTISPSKSEQTTSGVIT